MTTGKVIHFYPTRNPFGEFSNFAEFPILMKGVIWPTSEHYFQAQKFASNSAILLCRVGIFAHLVKRLVSVG